MEWYIKVLQKYGEFSGRARRKEYWMFALFNLIFIFITIILDNLLGTAIENVGYGLIYFLYAFAVLIPGLAVTARRLHDIGKSGWFILISLIPIIGAIVLFIFLVTDSESGENKYGSNPKESSVQNNTSFKHSGENDEKINKHKQVDLSGENIQYSVPERGKVNEYETTKLVANHKLTYPIKLYQHSGVNAGITHSISGKLQNNSYVAVLGRKVPDSVPDVNINELVISRKHLNLVMKEKAFYIQLAMAKNATYLNNDLVNPEEYKQIFVNDIIQVGDIKLEIVT